MFTLLFITSCTFKNLEQENNILFNTSKNQLKTLIIPEGTQIPHQHKEYDIPYTHEDLEKDNHDIFPPI